MFKKLSEKKLYQDPWIEFFQDEIEFDDGKKGTYTWVRRKNGVGIVVVTKTYEILLHREYRYVIKDYSWEVQGGGIDENETPEESAVRELQEEAGIKIEQSQLVKLGEFYPLHSFNTEKVTLFMVVIDKPQIETTHLEAGEMVDQHTFVSFEKALGMIDSGQINDVSTAHAIQMAVRKVMQAL